MRPPRTIYIVCACVDDGTDPAAPTTAQASTEDKTRQALFFASELAAARLSKTAETAQKPSQQTAVGSKLR